MFSSFRQKLQRENRMQERLSMRLAQNWIKGQARCAAYLQQQSKRFPGWLKKIIFVIFFLSSGLYSLLLVLECFKKDHPLNFSVTPIKIPKRIDGASDQNIKANAIDTEAE